MAGDGRTSDLLGRQREQAELYDALSLALRGDPQVVVVAGDAGLGKTTLVADTTRRAEELGFSVGVGHCLDIGADISFAPVIEAVSTLVARGEEDETRPLARRMRTLLDPGNRGSPEKVYSAWLWRFTFQRWWNFMISIPAFAALLARVGALTVADIGMAMGVSLLIGFRAPGSSRSVRRTDDERPVSRRRCDAARIEVLTHRRVGQSGALT